MQFQLTLDFHHPDMQTPEDVGHHLARAGAWIAEYVHGQPWEPGEGHSLLNQNGQRVGEWRIIDPTTPQPEPEPEPEPFTQGVLPDSVLNEISRDLGFDWSWANDIQFSDRIYGAHPTDPDYVLLTVGHWDDGEEHGLPSDLDNPYERWGGVEYQYTSTPITRQMLSDAVRALASGAVSQDPYQISAGLDYISDPEEADGDSITADLVIQWAIFGEVMFG